MSQILLLEDDEALGRGICMALETSSCTVTHCSTRCQATGILQSTAFDLLIFDINLPDGSGLELLRTLRQNGSFTPAILLTAMTWSLMKSPAWKPGPMIISPSPSPWQYSEPE